MNFGVTGGSIGLIGLFVLFGAGMLAFALVAAFLIRVVRGRDDEQATSDRRAPEDDYIL